MKNDKAPRDQAGVGDLGLHIRLAGNRLTKTLENGVTTSYVYDPANRLLTLNNQEGSNLLPGYFYTYNTVNDRLTRTETVTGREFLFRLNLYDYRNRFYSADLGRWLERDPLKNAERRQGPNLYEYVGNNPSINADPLGLAYFAYCGLSALGGTWLGIFSHNPLDDYTDTDISHEQLFFEDGKQPSNIGYGPSGKFSNEDPSKYHKSDGGYDDCIMRKAANEVNWPGSDYSLIGHNCQCWANAVRSKYHELENDPNTKDKCCKEKNK